MMAATWSDGFDLNAEMKNIRLRCEEIGFDEINSQIVLRSISAAADLGINKDDIQKLRTKDHIELRLAAQAAGDSLVAALTFLRDRVGAHTYGYIPYSFQLTYIAEFFRLAVQPSAAQLAHLTEWFWFTSVTRYFGTFSSTGQVTKDFALVRRFALGKQDRLFDVKEVDISRLLFDKFNLGTAASTAFALLLSDARPTTTVDGRLIDDSHRKVKSNREFSSFSPADGVVDKWNVAKIIYPFGKVARELGEQVDDEVLASHLLDRECLELRKLEKTLAFVRRRSDIVAERVRQLTQCNARYVIPPFATAADAGLELDEDDMS
jgi:hypothetical protein